MIDHLTLHVSDLDKSATWYAAALAPLGYSVLMRFPGTVGLGAEGKPDLWLAQGPLTPFHLAFAAPSNKVVAAFYDAAIAAGGKDNGGPGPRPYHPNYYGAFVFDPDGYNVEVVCHSGVAG